MHIHVFIQVSINAYKVSIQLYNVVAPLGIMVMSMISVEESSKLTEDWGEHMQSNVSRHTHNSSKISKSFQPLPWSPSSTDSINRHTTFCRWNNLVYLLCVVVLILSSTKIIKSDKFLRHQFLQMAQLGWLILINLGCFLTWKKYWKFLGIGSNDLENQ